MLPRMFARMAPLALVVAACSDKSMGPTDPADCFGDPHTLSVGGTVIVSGPQAAELCVQADAGGGDYIAIIHNGGLPSDTLQLEALGLGEGAIASLADERQALPMDPSRSFGDSRSSGAQLATAGITGLIRDDAFHSALRRRERSLEPMMPAARIALLEREQVSRMTPRFQIGTANPQVGDLVTINAQARNACADPIEKEGRIAAISARAIVVHDTENPAEGFSDVEYASIAMTYDTLIDPLNVENFGEPSDIDQNDRVFIFYTVEVNKLSEAGSGTFVGGFFFARDLFPITAQNGLEGCPTSNEAEIFYMLVPDPDGEVNDARSKEFVERVTIGTIAHEYHHLINASRRLFVTFAPAFEETWLDEGLSHIAEELVFYESANLDPRTNLNLDDVRQSQQVLDAFNFFGISNFFRFEDFLEAPTTSSPHNPRDALGTRGAAWHFLRYAADRRGGDEGTFWFGLVNNDETGLANLQDVLGTQVLTWTRDWASAVLIDDLVAAPAPFAFPSWNVRSIWTANPPFSGSYSLSVANVSTNTAVNRTLIPGGAAYLRLSLISDDVGAYQLRADGETPPGSLSVTLVRTR